MKNLFLSAALAALLWGVSCSTSETVPVGKASITVKITSPSAATRAVEDPADALTPVTPDITPGGTHYVYVVEGGTVVHAEPLTEEAEGATGQALKAGAKDFAPDAGVYVLVNIPDNIIAPGGLNTMTEIAGAISEIVYTGDPGTEHNTSYKYPAMGNYDGLAKQIDEADADTGVATVEVEISPLFARVELQGIKGGKWIKSFKVKNVWIDDYFSSFSMTGAGSVMNSMGQKYETAAQIPAGWFGDPVAELPWDRDTSTDPIVPETDKVWAYHVGAGSLVRIIVELSDVYRFPADGSDPESPDTGAPATIVTGPTFVTVTGYAQNLDSFQRGHIYSVRPIEFNNVGPINDDMVAITANVEILNWVYRELDPVVL